MKTATRSQISTVPGPAPARPRAPLYSADHPLQRLCGLGNQKLQRMLRSGAIQAKLIVNSPGDRYEQEADRIASAVAEMPCHPAASEGLQASVPPQGLGIQRMCTECEDELQRQAVDGAEIGDLDEEGLGNIEEEEPEPDESGMPKREAGNAGVSGETSIRVPGGSGQPLKPAARRFMEGAMGQDFSQVRVHTDSAAARSARQLRAHAYTVGSHIYFNQGEYRPDSLKGRKLLAHELTHVVQQTGGASDMPIAPKHVQRQPRRRTQARSGGGCPQGKQPRPVRDDCGTSGPSNRSEFIRHLEVSLSRQTVRATWGPRSGPATRTDRWDCSPNPTDTPTGPDIVGLKCSVNHTNRKRDGMAWFTGFQSEHLRIGFHDSQPVGPGIHSHGCVRVRCPIARTINRNTWSGVTTINVS